MIWMVRICHTLVFINGLSLVFRVDYRITLRPHSNNLIFLLMRRIILMQIISLWLDKFTILFQLFIFLLCFYFIIVKKILNYVGLDRQVNKIHSNMLTWTNNLFVIFIVGTIFNNLILIGFFFMHDCWWNFIFSWWWHDFVFVSFYRRDKNLLLWYTDSLFHIKKYICRCMIFTRNHLLTWISRLPTHRYRTQFLLK